MIKIENTNVYGWEAAIRGMRNPMNSWEKSDSRWYCRMNPDDLDSRCDECDDLFECGGGIYNIGSNDLDLMTRLRNAGTDHRKFMRMITVSNLEWVNRSENQQHAIKMGLQLD